MADPGSLFEDSSFEKCRRNLVLISLFLSIWLLFSVPFPFIEIFKVEIHVTQPETTIILSLFWIYLSIRFWQLKSRIDDPVYAKKIAQAEDQTLKYHAISLAEHQFKTLNSPVELRENESDRIYNFGGNGVDMKTINRFGRVQATVGAPYNAIFKDGNILSAGGTPETVQFDRGDVWFKLIFAKFWVNVKDTHFTEFNLPLIIAGAPALIFLLKLIKLL